MRSGDRGRVLLTLRATQLGRRQSLQQVGRADYVDNLAQYCESAQSGYRAEGECLMTQSFSSLIAIDHDDYYAADIGKTEDGRSFFLTTPFEPALGAAPGREFVALYLFDEAGGFLEAKIDDLGSRATLDAEARRALCHQRLEELGNITRQRIKIAPFSVERFGTVFGLVPREPEDGDDVSAVEAQPGNYMAFFEPWDSGEYDT